MLFQPPLPDISAQALRAGYRDGERGTHTSRTMMLAELRELFERTERTSSREDYALAIVEDNVLAKQTLATRKLTNQRLGELFGLSPDIPLFRALRVVWESDPNGLSLSALLVALARDPLLRLTARSVLSLPAGQELARAELLSDLRSGVGQRLSASTIEKVARNASSTWTQSGHLVGRVRKVRRRVEPSHGPVALAMWMGQREGMGGPSLLNSAWCRVLDHCGEGMIQAVLRAKQHGVLQATIGGGVVDINAERLDAVFYNAAGGR